MTIRNYILELEKTEHQKIASDLSLMKEIFLEDLLSSLLFLPDKLTIAESRNIVHAALRTRRYSDYLNENHT